MASGEVSSYGPYVVVWSSCCKEGIKNEKQRYWQHQGRLEPWQLFVGPGVQGITVGLLGRGMSGVVSYWVDLQRYLPGLDSACLPGRPRSGSLYSQQCRFLLGRPR